MGLIILALDPDWRGGIRWTKSGPVLGVIVVAALILLIPSMVYFWAPMT